MLKCLYCTWYSESRNRTKEGHLILNHFSLKTQHFIVDVNRSVSVSRTGRLLESAFQRFALSLRYHPPSGLAGSRLPKVFLITLAMSKDLGYKAVQNVESRRTWDRDYYEAKAKEKLEKGEDFKNKDDAPTRRGAKEEFQSAPVGAAGPAGSSRAYLKVSLLVEFIVVCVASAVGDIGKLSVHPVMTTFCCVRRS